MVCDFPINSNLVNKFMASRFDYLVPFGYRRAHMCHTGFTRGDVGPDFALQVAF